MHPSEPALRTCPQRVYDTHTSNDPIIDSQHKSHVLQWDKIIHGFAVAYIVQQCWGTFWWHVMKWYLYALTITQIWMICGGHKSSIPWTQPYLSQEKETAKLRHSRDAHYQLTKPLLVRFHTGHVTRLCRTLERCWLYDTSLAISAECTTRERLASVQCQVTQPSCSQIF